MTEKMVNEQSEGTERWGNPLADRYASKEMAYIWSDRHRYGLWRRMWLALAEAEAEMGLPITPSQLDQMRSHLDTVDFAKAAAFERPDTT